MNTMEIMAWTGYDPAAIDRSLKCEHIFYDGYIGTTMSGMRDKMIIKEDKICNKCNLPKSMIDEISELSKK